MKHLLKELGVVAIMLFALAIAPVANAQAENCGDCGQCWVVFFRCVQDPQCPGSKFCTWIIQSEFCGSWDTRGCYPQPLASNEKENHAKAILARARALRTDRVKHPS